MAVPSLADFLAMADGDRPILITEQMSADLETPLSVYWKLAHDETHSFLLESVTGGEQLARYSFIGVRPSEVVRSKGREATVDAGNGIEKLEIAEGRTPLDLLRSRMPGSPVLPAGAPKFVGGAVGTIAYDFVRFLEKLPDSNPDDLQLDDVAMMMVRTVVAFDHAKNVIELMALAEPTEAGYHHARESLNWMRQRIELPLPALPVSPGSVHEVRSNVTQDEFERRVERMKAYIVAGDGFQMVPSQRFSTKFEAHPLTAYRALRSLNPSPYMFLLRFGDFDVVGASPEILVSLLGRTARVRPIAGTRWRGQTAEEDHALEVELLADEKERAEHVMLVDLGRNDLGRVCTYGSVQVSELMVIERYSHVMHIVSDVTGTLQDGQDAFDLLEASFPAGTVTGAPKVRAMEIIDELESSRRGLYAGAAGYFSATGDLDMAIAIRTIVIKNGYAHVQAGGGVVYDSDPTKEYVETCNKARAALAALEIAQRGSA